MWVCHKRACLLFSHRIWLVRCLQRRSRTLWSGSSALLAPRWTSAPARCGSGGRGTASLCSSRWRLSPGQRTPPTAGWQRLRSIQPPTHPPPPHCQPPCHSLNRDNAGRSFSFVIVRRRKFPLLLYVLKQWSLTGSDLWPPCQEDKSV